MTKQDANQLKGKFDELMSAVETFGEASAQLSKAGEDIGELITAVQHTNQQLGTAATHCQEYLEAADKLISDGFTQQINQDISKVSDVITQCRRLCEGVTEQYGVLLNTFREDAGKLEERQNEVVRTIQTVSASSANTVRSELQTQTKAFTALLTEKTARLEKNQERSSKDILDITKTEIQKHTENEQENTRELLEAIRTLERKTEQVSSLSTKLETLLTSQFAASQAKNVQLAEQLSAQMKKQQMLILAGMGVLAVLAALGLFL